MHTKLDQVTKYVRVKLLRER